MSVITKAMNVVYSVILMQIVGLAWAYQIEGHGINPWLALMAVTILWLANVWWRAAADNNPCNDCQLNTCAGCHKADALWGSLYDAEPDANCITLADGSCIGTDCMHTSEEYTTPLSRVDRDWHCESTDQGPRLVFHVNDDWIKTDLYHCDLCGYEWSTANPCPEH